MVGILPNKYNHKEAIANLTPEQYQENLNWVAKSYRQALRDELITCKSCKNDFKLIALYRCWFCGSYFCRKCSKGHFGER